MRVVRDNDPLARTLRGDGWRVVGESWAARLMPDAACLEVAARAVARATAGGVTIAELDPRWADALAALDARTAGDYPQTPATPHLALSAAGARALWASGHRVFGALSGASSAADPSGGELLAVTVMKPGGAYAETEFTAVAEGYRRRGLAVAVKAAAIIRLAGEGVGVFGTGGAAMNAGSIAMNRALGYRITERWLSFAPPA